ncbi:3-oxoacyl-[acyl-carrier protein] reductase [Ruminococcus sp. YE71]|uniref:SDR family NAD(P)-dependent oxidoreductase n=1 Tax=unclassified Ruminococcus TaxID=2608920 RepID=UPI00088B3EF7|nr:MULTISPECIES: SDR family oxidoreductase [unclassified Ruminococcus]SDA11348.1 3-oxoacyl-[acyl-carrier protein] reductase [Ruminococcus sp. YE78]SFW15107.1 3-oxoacyl-[acyl-carrier protein] reductase [Ruminococcus sp. YE71]
MLLKDIIRKYFTIHITKAINTPIIKGNFLEGKVALIIGGSGGIGSAITKSFIDNGCKVIISGTNIQKMNDFTRTLDPDNIRSILLDTTDISKIKQAIIKAHEFFGPINIMVYSAGIHCTDSFGHIEESTWDNVMNINLKGMYFACQYFSDYLIENNYKGHILNVGSASCAKPGWTPYEISKCGVKSLTLGFADKLVKRGIIVNSIAPGPVATPMLHMTKDNITWEGNPTGRMCTPEEIANIAVAMVSNMGDMIVGDTFFVSGGSGTICIDK